MSGDNEPTDVVQQLIYKNQASFEQMGFGGVMGYCSGMAFRKAGRFVGVVVGMGFVGLQTMKHFGFVDVNWNKVKDSAIRPLDTNGDGKLDAKDAEVWWKRSQSILQDSVPEAGGFTAGFLLGARRA
mmetsp:Transcript_23194/g.64299  ORF Transcript_23194/g.64299 Transcript_23194/m.64299 type:complete len:127 (-) Transcript_23194:1543-1923(-)